MIKAPGFLKRFFARRQAVRNFDAAKVSRLLANWGTASTSIDEDVKGGLTPLRARSRDLCQNNDYGKKFMKLLAANVVGSAGIRLQSKAMRPAEPGAQTTLDTLANAKIESAWQKWCRQEFCTVTGKLSFVDVQKTGTFVHNMHSDPRSTYSQVLHVVHEHPGFY